MQRSIKYIGLSVLVIAGVFSLGFLVGMHHSAQPDDLSTAGGDVFWRVWSLIDQNYPDADKITPDTRIIGATQGLVASLGDPYSEFFDAKETQDFSDEIQGSFGGIGLEVDGENGQLVVTSALKGTPAETAGFKAGDIITKIGNQSTTGMSSGDAVDLIRGAIGTSVTLTVIHPGTTTPVQISVIRAEIDVPTVETKEVGNGIFYIGIDIFNAQAITDFDKAITQFKSSPDTKLILDVRGNPGGYLDAAVDIGSWFVPEGKTIVTENYGDTKAETVDRSKGYDLGKQNLQMVVLVDGDSASASEILAGALQDYGIAKLVGVQTYGKGSVQEVINVTDTMELKLTVAKWLTPNGHWISGVGLTPDVIVKQTTPIQNPGDPNDLQFAKAVQLLTN